jgi:hypothetical protein
VAGVARLLVGRVSHFHPPQCFLRTCTCLSQDLRCRKLNHQPCRVQRVRDTVNQAVKILLSEPAYGTIKGSFKPGQTFAYASQRETDLCVLLVVAYSAPEIEALGCWPGAHVMLQVGLLHFMSHDTRMARRSWWLLMHGSHASWTPNTSLVASTTPPARSFSAAVRSANTYDHRHRLTPSRVRAMLCFVWLRVH